MNSTFLKITLYWLITLMIQTTSMASPVQSSSNMSGSGISLNWQSADGAEEPIVSITGNTIRMGTVGLSETSSMPRSIHGAVALLPPAQAYRVTFSYTLSTWDSYTQNIGPGTGYWDSFSICVTDNEPYWKKSISTFPYNDPINTVQIPGLLMVTGGLFYGGGLETFVTNLVTVTVVVDPEKIHYLNIQLDTQTGPEANHLRP